MRKLLLLFLFICGLVLHAQAQKNVELSSPNGEIKVSVRLTDKIYYDVACNDEVLLKDNYLQLKLKDKIGRIFQSGLLSFYVFHKTQAIHIANVRIRPELTQSLLCYLHADSRFLFRS